jgi:hypothetical protein
MNAPPRSISVTTADVDYEPFIHRRVRRAVGPAAGAENVGRLTKLTQLVT